MLARVQLTLAAALALVAAVLGGVLLLGSGGEVRGASGNGLSVGPYGFVGALRPTVPPKDFTLLDERGRPGSLAALRGKVIVLTFLYTTCQDTCPTTASQIRLALDDLQDDGAEPVPALAVSVDPVNDTAPRARRFLGEQSLTGRMRFLLGERAQLAPVWRDYGVQPQRAGKPATGADARDFEHSAYVLLIDRDGRQRIGFPLSELTPESLAHDIRRLLAEPR